MEEYQEETPSSVKWHEEEWPISKLVPCSYNPRKITRHDRDQLSRSLDRFGQCDPLIIQPDGRIIGGHQRYAILKQKKVKTVKVSVPSRELTEEEFQELMVRLNRNNGEWDYDVLANAFDTNSLLDFGFLLKDFDIGGDGEEGGAEEGAEKKSLHVTFRSADDLEDAIEDIQKIVQKYQGAKVV